jgi:hypothetical protein
MSIPIASTVCLHAGWPALALIVFIAATATAPALADDAPVLSQMQAVANTSEEAATLRPPPDLEDLWLTVLLKISPGTTPSGRSSGGTWYVSVSAGGDKPVDLPATAIAKAQIPGIKILPASAAPSGSMGSGATQGDYHIGIGIPLKRPDGNYDITYSYYCGVVCAASMTAVVSHDHWGWRIISIRTNWVS